jgi:hypothetical protein
VNYPETLLEWALLGLCFGVGFHVAAGVCKWVAGLLSK